MAARGEGWFARARWCKLGRAGERRGWEAVTSLEILPVLRKECCISHDTMGTALEWTKDIDEIIFGNELTSGISREWFEDKQPAIRGTFLVKCLYLNV